MRREVLWPGLIMASMLVASFLSALWFENIAAAVCFAALLWSLEQS